MTPDIPAPQSPHPDLVLRLVEECIDVMERDGMQAVEQVCARHPEHAAAVRKRLKWLTDVGLLPIEGPGIERTGIESPGDGGAA